MKIKISSLKEGRHFYNFDVPIEELDLTSSGFFGNVMVNVQLEKTKRHILLIATITVNKHCECDRCLREYDRQFLNEYHMFYIDDVQNKDFYDEDVVTVIRNDLEYIDISKDVREYALLAIPMKNLCKEDCKGLCSHCGKDLNEGECGCTNEKIDPRWIALKNLYKQ